VKKILILTASFGEGHNAAARGLRDAFARIDHGASLVEVHDLFAETYGAFNNLARWGYLAMISSAPRIWSALYRSVDRKKDFAGNFRLLFAVKNRLSALLARFRPDVIVSVYPAYPHLLDEILGRAGAGSCPRVVIITDSITVNSVWFRCSADFFLVPNEATAEVLRQNEVPPGITKDFGFPVSPKFAELGEIKIPPSSDSPRRILYMINAAKSTAPELVRRLVELSNVDLIVTVGRDERLRNAIENVRSESDRHFEIVGWSEEMPRLMKESHLLIGKAGGATVQETIAAATPMIINQVVPGQEEGNAQLVLQSKCGAVAASHNEVIAQVERAFVDDAKQWHEWEKNISALSRPRAAFDIADFLLSI
jgi:processive 1,2-diacylglycerol beta-glucosyltransferase